MSTQNIKITVTFLILFSVVCATGFGFRFALADAVKTTNISTYGTIVTDSSRRTAFRGVTLGGNPSKWRDYGSSTYNRFKDWGFNSIWIIVWHSNIEPYENQPGVYDESLLKDIDRNVQLGMDRGLYMFIGLHGPYGSADPNGGWRGWGELYGWDGLNYNRKVGGVGYRDRYINCLKMLAQRYPGCGIGLTYFPYHKGGESEEDRRQYNTVTAPLMYKAVRPLTDEYLHIAMLSQGQEGDLTNGEYSIVEQYGWTPFPDVTYDPKLQLGFNNHGKDLKIMEKGGTDWTKARVREHYAPLVAFQSKYASSGVTFGCVESTPIVCFGTQEYNGITYDCSVRPIKQERLDYLEYQLQYMNQHDFSWWYHSYAESFTWDTPIDPDFQLNGVGLTLVEYA